MFTVERRNKIISLLNEKKSITVQDTAKYFGVAEETIRRDLNELEGRRLLIRTHGGAIIPEDTRPEISYEMRKKINIEGKNIIGKEASKLVFEGDTIILDASTSSFFAAKHIKNKKNITVITNAQNVIVELSDCPDITVISTGGLLRPKSMSFVGRAAENALINYYANKLFFSCMGFTPDRGLTDSNGQESEMKKIMIKCSQKKIFLCDYTKFGKVGYAATAGARDFDILITDKELDKEKIEDIKSLGIKVITAG